MIVPAMSHDELLADFRAADVPGDGLRMWWLGQSGFLVQCQGCHLLLDPYLSDSLTVKYASTDKPHVRMTRLAISPDRLDFIDAVTSSHNHTDHLDGETLVPLLLANPELMVIVPAANRLFAAERIATTVVAGQTVADAERRLMTIDDGQSVSAGAFTVHAIPAAHETVERDEQGRCRFLGYVVQIDKWTIYHSGDTMLYSDMVDRLRPWSIDIALLPINGRAPERRVAGNLWGREAAQLAHAIGARYAIPCHYEMFEFNTATPDEFVAECQAIGQSYRVLECGERFEL